jgi:hypothetical protein
MGQVTLSRAHYVPYSTLLYCSFCGVWVPRESQYVKVGKDGKFYHNVFGCGRALRTRARRYGKLRRVIG